MISSFAILSFSQCVYLSTSVLYSVVVHFLRGILLVIIVSFKSLSHLESLSVLNFAELVSGVKINWLFDTIFILYILAASIFPDLLIPNLPDRNVIVLWFLPLGIMICFKEICFKEICHINLRTSIGCFMITWSL